MPHLRLLSLFCQSSYPQSSHTNQSCSSSLSRNPLNKYPSSFCMAYLSVSVSHPPCSSLPGIRCSLWHTGHLGNRAVLFSALQLSVVLSALHQRRVAQSWVREHGIPVKPVCRLQVSVTGSKNKCGQEGREMGYETGKLVTDRLISH